MASRRIRPAKPHAVLTAVVGVGMLAVGIWIIAQGEAPIGFVALWIVALVAIVGFNLWAAFAKGGHTYRVEDS